MCERAVVDGGTLGIWGLGMNPVGADPEKAGLLLPCAGPVEARPSGRWGCPGEGTGLLSGAHSQREETGKDTPPWCGI